uniref:Uncharacterized mitochondrial protein AtMg00810-like n=1 Tax=Nicotiana tabacum TaxID=4097 RepID=A0A1S3XAZ5_TOBAC|nr:PREDICTED: uncharacterized mitochondrial protein AtMg00810-like [Nicotiana tabacum]
MANIMVIFQIEPKKVDEALKDSSWVQAMQEELDLFDKNQVWTLVPKPANAAIIGTKWVSRNKLNEEEKATFICQTKYTKEMIQKFGISNEKALGTLISPSTTLDKDEEGKPIDALKYCGMIRSLLYLTASRPDIIFRVCKYARYLIGTTSHELWYPHCNNFKLGKFAYVDLAGDKDDRKSTSGTCQLLGKSLISWNSKKQGSVALSTTEA